MALAAILVLGNPLLLGPIKRQTGSAIERVLIGVHYEITLAVLILQLKLIEGNGYVLFARSKKPPTPMMAAFTLPSFSRIRSLTSPILLSFGS